MERSEFITRINAHRKSLNELWADIYKDVNEFTEDGEKSIIDLPEANSLVSDLLFNGSWIDDRLHGFTGTVGSKTYNKSLTKKIRKSLGYTH